MGIGDFYDYDTPLKEEEKKPEKQPQEVDESTLGPLSLGLLK